MPETTTINVEGVYQGGIEQPLLSDIVARSLASLPNALVFRDPRKADAYDVRVTGQVEVMVENRAQNQLMGEQVAAEEVMRSVISRFLGGGGVEVSPISSAPTERRYQARVTLTAYDHSGASQSQHGSAEIMLPAIGPEAGGFRQAAHAATSDATGNLLIGLASGAAFTNSSK